MVSLYEPQRIRARASFPACRQTGTSLDVTFNRKGVYKPLPLTPRSGFQPFRWAIYLHHN